MTVNILSFLGALLLLWCPRLWLRRGYAQLGWRQRRRSGRNPIIVEPWREREPGDPQIDFRAEFAKGGNYADLLRAGIGGLLLWGGLGFSPAVSLADDAPRNGAWLALALNGGVALMGLLLQAIRREKGRLSFFPPVFYLTGLSVALCDARGAAFAFVLIWAVNPLLPNARMFLSVYSLMLAVFGRFFGVAALPSLALAVGLVFLPVLLSLLANRPLTVFSCKTHHRAGTPA